MKEGRKGATVHGAGGGWDRLPTETRKLFAGGRNTPPPGTRPVGAAETSQDGTRFVKS
jgi:hypothetical protein